MKSPLAQYRTRQGFAGCDNDVEMMRPIVPDVRRSMTEGNLRRCLSGFTDSQRSAIEQCMDGHRME
jgi:hypothetical protein